MLNSDAPSTARLKSQPQPSTEAKLEHGHPSVNRSGELIYFSRQSERRVMDPLIGANEEPRPHLACSCTHSARGTNRNIQTGHQTLPPAFPSGNSRVQTTASSSDGGFIQSCGNVQVDNLSQS